MPCPVDGRNWRYRRTGQLNNSVADRRRLDQKLFWHGLNIRPLLVEHNTKLANPCAQPQIIHQNRTTTGLQGTLSPDGLYIRTDRYLHMSLVVGGPHTERPPSYEEVRHPSSPCCETRMEISASILTWRARRLASSWRAYASTCCRYGHTRFC